MNLVVVITDLFIGGSPRVTADLVIDLQRSHGFSSTVISLKPLPPAAQSAIVNELRAANIEVLSLNARSGRQLFAAARALADLITQKNPPVVYSLLVHANLVTHLALRRLGKNRPRHIQSIHTVQPYPRWHWWLQRWLNRHADGFVAPSHAILDKLGLKESGH